MPQYFTFNKIIVDFMNLFEVLRLELRSLFFFFDFFLFCFFFILKKALSFDYLDEDNCLQGQMWLRRSDAAFSLVVFYSTEF